MVILTGNLPGVDVGDGCGGDALTAATTQTRPPEECLWQVWKGVPCGGINSSQTATIVVVVKQSLGSWSSMWSLSNVNGCGSTSLFGSRAGTHQGK